MLNVKAEDEALADMIVYYVGGRPDLLFPFLRSLFAGHPTRSTPLTPEDLARAWEESSFREAARTALLEPIADDPRGRAVLGAALYLGQPPAWTVTTADVCSAIDVFWGGGLDEGETRQALDRLAGSGLLTLVPDRVTYRFPLSGISSLLLAAIPDADAFVQSALRDACSAT